MIGIAHSGSDAANAATRGASVTVLGAAGKTGRECVEYLASRGTGRAAVPDCVLLLTSVLACFGLDDTVTFGGACRYVRTTVIITAYQVYSNTRPYGRHKTLYIP